MSQALARTATRAVALLAGALLAAAPAFASGLASPGCSAGDLDLAQATNPCDPLVDVFTTVGDFTEFTFGEGGVPPLPADFFFPGSQPFKGAVRLTGVPTFAGGDTVLRRTADPQPGTTSTVGVTVIGLALSSIEPLAVVGADGTVDPWLLAVNLSGKQPSGELTARFDSPQGGTSTCKLPISPTLTFVRQADVQASQAGRLGTDRIEVRTLDFAQAGLPPIVLNTADTPFSTVPVPWDPCRNGRFFPGVLPGGSDSVIVSTGPPFVPVRHVVQPPPPPPPKRCDYAHVSSTASTNPPCRPNCPAGLPPYKGPACNVVADCPPFQVKQVACATQGHCAEVYAVFGCS